MRLARPQQHRRGHLRQRRDPVLRLHLRRPAPAGRAGGDRVAKWRLWRLGVCAAARGRRGRALRRRHRQRSRSRHGRLRRRTGAAARRAPDPALSRERRATRERMAAALESARPHGVCVVAVRAGRSPDGCRSADLHTGSPGAARRCARCPVRRHGCRTGADMGEMLRCVPATCARSAQPGAASAAAAGPRQQLRRLLRHRGRPGEARPRRHALARLPAEARWRTCCPTSRSTATRST